MVVADWYGQMDDGSPFHGSIVRGLDATDPANIKVLGEAKQEIILISPYLVRMR